MQLSIAKKTTFDLLKEEGLLKQGWRASFDDAKNRLGKCDYKNQLITLSRYYIALNSDDVTLDTIRHEVAHALTEGDGHGDKWKREAERLGAAPMACATGEIISPDGVFVGKCPGCGGTISKHKEFQKIGKIACTQCCRTHSEGKFDRRFLYIWRNTKTGEIFDDGEWRKDENFVIHEIDTSIADEFIETFGAAAVIEMKDIGKLPDFRFDDYDFKSTPEGVFQAFLEIKMFRRIKEYEVLRTFWQTSEADGIVIDVWANYDGEYETADRCADIEKMKVGKWYELIVMRTPKGFLRLQSAKLSK